MTTPYLPQMDPGGEMTHNVVPPVQQVSPFTSSWFTQSNLTDIDHEMMGWLIAQGWTVTSVTYDETTAPPTPRYAMSKQSMNNWLILQQLMTSLTSAFNEGRGMNYLRYRDIVTVWNHAFDLSQQQYSQMTTKSNADVAVYFSAFNNDMAAVATQIGLARSESLAEADRVATQLAAYLDKLGSIEANYEAHAAIVNVLLTQQAAALEDYLIAYNARLDVLDAEYVTHTDALTDILNGMDGDVEAHVAAQLVTLDAILADYTAHSADIGAIETTLQATVTAHSAQIESLLSSILADYNSLESSINTSIASLDTAFDNHAADFDAILDLLVTDFTTHAATTRALLVNLGTTELARINEEYDARLSDVAQKLADRGFYSSALLSDQRERVERERSELISKHNDDLAREKLTNEHRLFEQQAAMRARSMEGSSRLYGIQQDVLRYEAQSTYQLHGQLQSARDRTLAARQSLYGIKESFARLQVDLARGLEAELQNARSRTLETKDRIQAARDALDRVKLQNASQIFAELTAIRGRGIESTVQTHGAKQDVSRALATQRDRLLGQLNNAVSSLQDGRAKYSAMSLQKGEYLSGMRIKLNVQMMEIVARNLQMLQGTSQAELELMKYQVDTRNNFLVGMFRVIQDRTDEYPDLSEIAKLSFSLGDAGSGWVAP